MSSTISDFIDEHFRHFNARALKSAADGYRSHLDAGGKMFFTMAGAMSTAELGRSLAEMIRRDKIHAICCTGANLEEDLFNLVAHDHYVSVADYRYLSAEDETALLSQHLNRVTDTCIPEQEAIRRIEGAFLPLLQEADSAGKKRFPHEFLYQLIRNGDLEEHYQIPVENSWLIAASEKNLPIFVPGWEDSTLGNIYTGMCMRGDIKDIGTIRTGIHYMIELAEWLPVQVHHRSAFSKSVVASQGIFRSVWCRCCARISSAGTPRSGATSAKSVTLRPAMDPTQVPSQTRRSPGRSFRRIARLM